MLVTDTHTLPTDVSWSLEGRLVEASNLVLRLTASHGVDVWPEDRGSTPSDAVRAVYKPVAGERPLADFPPGTLAHREVAAFLVCVAMGWSVVPQTRWYEGEFGAGSLQRWVGPIDPIEQDLVTLLDEDEYEQSRGLHAVAAFEGEDGVLVLTHTDTPDLRRVAALDLVTNNADRKGSHLIETAGDLFAIDNGLTFHPEDKLRTVLWGFAGDELGFDITGALDRLVQARTALTRELAEHLTPEEIEALHARTDSLRSRGEFPGPPQQRYALPWPPL